MDSSSFKPGDLVKLDPVWYSQETVDKCGLGLYLEYKNGWDYIYWFKAGAGSRARRAGAVAGGLIKIG